MYAKIIISFLLLEIIDCSSLTTSKANKLLEDLCQTLHDENGFKLDEDKQWEVFCRELFDSKDDDQMKRRQRDVTDEENSPPNLLERKISIRTGGSRISGGGSRIPTGGSRISGGGSGSSSSSSYRYVNTRTGTRLSRPNGWQWSRTGLIFLPLSTRYFHRSRSSSNRYTTPSTGSQTYYYCTSNTSSFDEIQCESSSSDQLCCEDTTTQNAFCCGDDLPDFIIQEFNRATKTIARIFYTLAAVALCMHLLMRRFYR